MPDLKIAHKIDHAEFYVEGILFDMDGTLVDSIGAVEEAWGSVAEELGKDPVEVIEATHGRRAIDNLRDLKPELAGTPDEKMDPHVKQFEERILERADSFSVEVRSRRQSAASSRIASRRGSNVGTPQEGSKSGSRSGSRPPSGPPSRHGSMSAGKSGRQMSFANELSRRMQGMQLTQMSMIAAPAKKGVISPADSGVGLLSGTQSPTGPVVDDNVFEDDDDEVIDLDTIEVDTSDLVDNSVKILPGVRRMIDSLPDGRWCVATSGATTYCHGALARVGIALPPVVVTADHKELKRGKPFPDPFILAAEKLGYDVKKCLVVEDSPSGIKAGVASGATVIAVCTSHPKEKIENCGQTYLVPTLECVTVEPQPDGRLKILIHDPVEC